MDSDANAAAARLPSLIVIGAAKSGTTSLYHYLRQHPDIYLPPHEEPSFFAFEGKSFDFKGPPGIAVADNRYPRTSLAEYLELYSDAPDGATLGDVSPAYLYWPVSAERIRRYVPNARLCVILRQPAERAYSGYLHARREEREPLHDFAAALEAEAERIEAGWGLLWRYADQGFYARQLRPYLELFERDQIRILLHEDLATDADGVMASLFSFAGVHDRSDLIDTNTRYNVSGMPRSRVLHQAMTARTGPILRAGRTIKAFVPEGQLRKLKAKIMERNANAPDPLDAELRSELTARFEADITELAELIGRDLSHWLP